MANTSKQATATMTEVKNKIGTVFDKVDKYGQVVITSYSRTRYVISKIEDDGTIPEKHVQAEPIVKEQKAEPQYAAPVVEKTSEIAKTAENAEKNNKVEAEEIEIREPVLTVEEKKPEPLPEVGNLRGAFLDLESFLWDRKSPVELSWVKKTRLSF